MSPLKGLPWPRRVGWLNLCVALAWLLAVLPAAAQRMSVDRGPFDGRMGNQMSFQGARPYLVRAGVAHESGDAAQELAILEEGLRDVGAESPPAFWLYQEMRQHYADRGNLVLALRTAERQYKVASAPGQELQVLASITALRAGLRDFSGAEDAMAKMQYVLDHRLRGGFGWPQQGDGWQANAAWAIGNYHAHAGHLAEAEAEFQRCLGWMQIAIGTQPDIMSRQAFLQADCAAGLIKVLLEQGRLTDAGVLAVQQRGFIDALAQAQQRPQVLARVAPSFARVSLEQGRTDEARTILENALAQLLAAGAGEGSVRVALLRLELAQLEMLEGRWEQALTYHIARKQGLLAAGSARGSMGVTSPEFGYTLVRLGRTKEAVALMEGVVDKRAQLFDESSIYHWEARAFHGVALAADGQREAALQELSIAVPKLLALAQSARSASEAGVLRSARLGWVLDGYLMLLADQATSGPPERRGEAVAEAFRIADIARGSTVHDALAASASRAASGDPALADLARREQDLQREISGLSETIGSLLAPGRTDEQAQRVATLQASLTGLRKTHEQVRQTLRERFPAYAELIAPRPIGLQEVRRLLKPGEALLSIYVGPARTLVWSVSAQGEPAFAVVALDAEQIGALVARVRRSLDAGSEPLRRLPPFDAQAAHALYRALLAPVAAGWAGAQELIVVPHGPLGQLPFAVLLTLPWQSAGGALPYADFAGAPWLLKQVAVSQLPSAASLAALRNRPATARPARPFVGFGDPVFVSEGAGAPGVERDPARRNLSVVPAGGQSEPMAGKIDFSLLPGLPDTAQEVQEVGKTLDADPARDLFLGRRASEHNVKATDLAAYRVVMFATHGLLSHEMPGLYQPALALANPTLSRDGEDGMLTLEDVLGLKLRADWVVLSACNTASSGRTGGEAVSGLGRAFFYAGAQALLVTQWPVETVSARLLTTEMFRLQKDNPGLSRARALRASELALMQRAAGAEYSYAHPMFWAPYVVVGDGS